jgi:hypothetical protein
MQLGAVAFVLAEAIFWKTPAKVTHHPVASDLRDHAGGGDAQTHAITLDDRGLWKWKWDNGQAVNQDVIREPAQSFDRSAHRLVRRAQNVDSVNLDVIDDADCPDDFGVSRKIDINLLAQLWRELFGIVQFTMPKLFRKNHCRRDNRAGQRTAPGLIDPGDLGDAKGAQFLFMPETAATIHGGENTEKLKAEKLKYFSFSVFQDFSPIRGLPSLPCPCACEGNLIWRA